MTTTMSDVRRLVDAENGLAIISTARPDGTVLASMVNAGVVNHPVTGVEVVAFVAVGGSRKLDILRARSAVTATFRSGWEYATVEGSAQLCGPNDELAGVDTEVLRLLLREIFRAAGGSHEDWETFDTVMAQDRRSAVLIHPTRIYGRRPYPESQDPGSR